MKNGYKKFCMFFILIISLTIAVLAIMNRTGRATVIHSYETYTVQPGDTIWSIAKRYTKGDPRKLIYKIQKLNKIGPVIYQRQQLKIPTS